ncbi:hypothetical protein AAKU58_003958 [Oxalobacteraceae bacterium GrIS 1.18]
MKQMNKNFLKNILAVVAGFLILANMTGCSTFAEKTNMLSDQSATDRSAAIIGVPASTLTLTSRSPDGSATTFNFVATNKKEYTCVIVGGSLASLGSTSMPRCAKKGDPLPAGTN